MLPGIRLSCHQLAEPSFSDPKALVQWMGALQAQDYGMARWALGIRLREGTAGIVRDALRRGDILRTHIMRPTWHFVAADDIRWMLQLSAQRIRTANESYAKGIGQDISESQYIKANDRIARMLEGTSLTREELASGLARQGIPAGIDHVRRYLMRAETDGIVCSGPDKEGKPTYALLAERAPQAKELPAEEALATLALRYFRSHSPATLSDFAWWSGLTLSEARKAIGLIAGELATERFPSGERYIYRTSPFSGKATATKPGGDTLHLLPAYDEYLIGYRDRTDVLAPEHRPKAHNNWGIFYPVVLRNGRVAGNWKKTVKKGMTSIGISLFGHEPAASLPLPEAAAERCRAFFDGCGLR